MPKTVTSTKSKKNSKSEVSETQLPVQTQESLAPVSAPVSLQVSEPVSEPVSASVSESVSNLQEVAGSEVVEQVSEESSTELLFNKAINQFQEIQNAMKTLHYNLKVLQKEVLREKKESKKKESKIKKKSEKKKNPSGFAKPSPITSELANFLGLPPTEQIARTDVTSKVIAYVKTHNLQNPENKKQIVPDAKLNGILQSGNDVVTFFNLQTYLKKHFLSNTVTSVEQSVTVV
jgi:chromatin remodeling complex protein RSC6